MTGGTKRTMTPRLAATLAAGRAMVGRLTASRRRPGLRSVPGHSRHCGRCRNFVVGGGPCPGLVPRDPALRPLCFIDVTTGLAEAPELDATGAGT